MRLLIFLLVLIALSLPAVAQDPFTDHETLQASPKVRRPGLPITSFEEHNQLLMRAFYPDYYKSEQKIARDIRWVGRNDSTIMEMWDTWGDSILTLLEDYSGIKWQEPHIRIHLVKYLREDGMYDPIIFPLQAVKKDRYSEAVPYGLNQLLNYIKYFAGRNLLQADLPGRTRLHIADHPLMEKTAYRFDVMVLCLTMACAEQIIPIDSLNEITSSYMWRYNNPGWELYLSHFKYGWGLTPETPLAGYIAEEPYSSPLVTLTRPPRIIRNNNEDQEQDEQIRMAATGGRLGFSVIKNQKNYLEVVDIDTLGLAYTCGLMLGDQIKRVNGEYARNARDLMGKILDQIDGEGVYLVVVRDDEEIGILLVPPAETTNPIEDY